MCNYQLAKSKGIKIVERKIKPEEMGSFVGCFLTGTAAEITPVSQIDKFNFTVCDVIKSLSENYQNLVRKKLPLSFFLLQLILTKPEILKILCLNKILSNLE